MHGTSPPFYFSLCWSVQTTFAYRSFTVQLEHPAARVLCSLTVLFVYPIQECFFFLIIKNVAKSVWPDLR
jgi:hypothetical protein